MIPSLARTRDAIAKGCDPQGFHRMSRGCSAFAASLASSYLVSAHDDSGSASETILFLNCNSPRPGALTHRTRTRARPLHAAI